ncbi:MAG: NYN domain-containing protein, partial [bacterium]|nr:NYN domain-containing protein [bacterium]
MIKKETVYAFIDSQNLNLGTQSLGWKLDFRKFYIYLRDKYKISKAFLFIGYLESNQKLYDNLTKWGYILVFKPAIRFNRTTIKGNIDAELVLHAAKIQYPNYDLA